jgi:hypothetical protein
MIDGALTYFNNIITEINMLISIIYQEFDMAIKISDQNQTNYSDYLIKI